MARPMQVVLGCLVAIGLLPVAAQANVLRKNALEELCRDFPLNSRCVQREQAAAPVPAAREFKILLHEVPGSSEWVRVEQQGNRYRVVHSRCLQNEATRLLAIAFPFPPFYNWYDHPVTHVSFSPKACAAGQGQCKREVDGDLLELGEFNPTDGTFEIEYAEGGFSRSVAFTLPAAAADKRSKSAT